MRNLISFSIVSAFLLISCQPDFKKLQSGENIHNLSTETQLSEDVYAGKIESFYEEGLEGVFVGKEAIPIYYKIFQQVASNSPAILISAGRTEAAVKYKELIFDLFRLGFSVYIHDHRGQGLSGRMTEDPDMGYVDKFQYYIDDMKAFYDRFVATEQHNNIYLLAHSMGGAIGITYLEQYPEDFSAAAFSSPMLGLVTPTCGAVRILTDKEPEYAAGQGKYKEVPFEKNEVTGSRIRYRRIDEAFAKDPEARLGGATYQWVDRSCKQFDYMNSHIDKIETPFILFSADHEQIVDTEAHEEFIDRAKELDKECIAYLVENAQHELFVEKDEQRIATINQIISFYASY